MCFGYAQIRFKTAVTHFSDSLIGKARLRTVVDNHSLVFIRHHPGMLKVIVGRIVKDDDKRRSYFTGLVHVGGFKLKAVMRDDVRQSAIRRRIGTRNMEIITSWMM